MDISKKDNLPHRIETGDEKVPSVPITPTKEQIAYLVEKALGVDPISVHEVSYWLHEVKTKDEVYVVRTHWEREKVRAFRFKEGVLANAHKEDIPVPSVLHTGDSIIPFAYQIFEKMEGFPASTYKKDHGRIWHQLGDLISRLHNIEAPGFGHVRFWIPNDKLYKKWKGFVGSEIERFREDMPLFETMHIDLDFVEESLQMIESMSKEKYEPRIIHGNLNLNNILVDDHGNITGIVSWDEAFFGPAPYGDLVPLSLWVYITDRHKFFEGYGIMPDEWKTMKKELIPFQLLYLVNHLSWYAEIGDMELIDKILWCMHEITAHA